MIGAPKTAGEIKTSSNSKDEIVKGLWEVILILLVDLSESF